MSRSLSQAALIVILIEVSALVLANDQPGSQQRKAMNTGKTSGVIVKLEPAEQGNPGQERTWRLTVNTDVVWRDFVRDQAMAPVKAARTGTAKAAAKGKKSVANEGHPRDKEMMATVNVDSRTEITMRFRSSTDEISEGSATPEGASQADEAIDSSSKTKAPPTPPISGPRRQSLKARILEPMELKPGLWIDVEFQSGDKENRARRVIVLHRSVARIPHRTKRRGLRPLPTKPTLVPEGRGPQRPGFLHQFHRLN